VCARRSGDCRVFPRARAAACAKLRANLATGHTSEVSPLSPSDDFARSQSEITVTSEAGQFETNRDHHTQKIGDAFEDVTRFPPQGWIRIDQS
jgi:hypothetical protein